MFTLSHLISFVVTTSFFLPLTQGQSIVWEALNNDNNGVRVYSDDTYEIVVENNPWFHSIPSQLFINGTWYVSSSPTGNETTCTFQQDIDCRGSDLYNFTAQGPNDCCLNCSGTAECGAWTYTGTTSSSIDSNDSLPPWAFHCYLKSDCSGKSTYAGHISGVKSPATAALLRLGATPLSGNDPVLGNFNGYQIQYEVNNTQLNFLFYISFKYYTDNDFFTFEQAFPTGAYMFNNSSPENSTSSSCAGVRSSSVFDNEPPLTEFCSSKQASSIFPGFTTTDTVPPLNQSGYVTWNGRFCYLQNGAGIGNGIASAGGSEGGPIVFYSLGTDTNPSYVRPTNAFVLGPVDNFKSNILGEAGPGYSSDSAGGFGIQGYITSVPNGFISTTGLLFSTNGVTDVMHNYGNLLLTKYNTTRMHDPFISNLGYYTDNGAYYDWYSYSNITSKGVPENVLMELSQTFRNGSYGTVLPVTYYQLDAYWYPYERSDGNCKVNDTVWNVPFPHGLPYLANELETPFLIYNGPTCGDTSLTNTWPFIYSNYWNQGWGSGYFAQIHPDASYDYYSQLFRTGKTTLAMGGFEIDFLDMNYLLFPAFTTNVSGSQAWLGGMAQAAIENDLTIQYCMELPSDILLSVLFPSVTNARASEDYGAGGTNYLIGGSSLLLSSVGIAASKDNFWSSQNEVNPYLVAAVTALSCGPVGFADEVGYTNPDVVMRTTTANGTLLHPSRPATTIDRLLIANANAPLAGNDVRIAPSTIPNNNSGIYYTILASGTNNLPPVPTSIVTEDFWPSLPSSIAYVMWGWNTSSTLCQNGNSANVCIFPVVSAKEQEKLVVSTSVLRHDNSGVTPYQIYHVTPVSPNGYIFLGEDNKYVAVSPYRFTTIMYGTDGITVELTGGSSETVTLLYVRPTNNNPIVVVKSVTLGTDGTLTVLLN